MISKRFYAVVTGIAVTAAACGGAVSGGDETSSSPDSETSADDSGSDNVELVSPTDTDRPFDLSGGATSSDDGVTVVTEDPLDGLRTSVAQATSPWPTDWTRRTVDIGEFLTGINTLDAG